MWLGPFYSIAQKVGFNEVCSIKFVHKTTCSFFFINYCASMIHFLLEKCSVSLYAVNICNNQLNVHFPAYSVAKLFAYLVSSRVIFPYVRRKHATTDQKKKTLFQRAV